jgi:tetratricopeptide (TPR) repeat protein
MSVDLADLSWVRTVADLGRVLRELRRRQARQLGTAERSYRELAARTGWAHGAIGEYLGGRTLPPTDRFDVLVMLLGASPTERGALATARDRVAELRRPAREQRGRVPAEPGPDGAAARSDAEAGPPDAGDADAGAPRSGAGPEPVEPDRPVPRELPPEVFGFRGRERERAELDRLLAESGSGPAAVLAVVVGMAGVGKTALAVSWAHGVREAFPDGQLYVDLRGYDPDRPTPPERALAALLRSLGVRGADLPPDGEELARRYRSLLAGRRMLVMLDNAYAAEQVRSLLPGSPSCFVLVTSRDDLAGLVARDGARRVELPPLPDADAVGLLGALIGPRVRGEPAAAAVLARRCARLPLALRIAAELVAARPDTPLGALTDELGRQDVLNLLDAGDARSAIRPVFSWSLRHLPDATADCFRLLGLHPGHSVDAAAAAALAGTDPGTAQGLLDRLERAHLVQRGRDGRYHMHDLLRAYAAELGAEHPEAREATTRLLDHYLRTATAAMDALFPLDSDRGPEAPGMDPGAALAWLDAERANLVAACVRAGRDGWPRHCFELARTLWRYLDAHAHYQDALAVHAAALDVATPGSRECAQALSDLGIANWRLGRCETALDLLSQAVPILEGTPEQVRVLANLGIVYEQLGRYQESLEYNQLAVEAYREQGDGRREAGALGNLGVIYWRLGRHGEAIECHEQAAAAARELGDARLEGYTRANLGLVYQEMGRYPEAVRSHHLALESARRFGDRRAEADTLSGLGVTFARMRRFDESIRHLELALGIAGELGHRGLEAETLNNLGEVLVTTRRFAEALDRHNRAYAVATEVGDRYEQARALDGSARALAGTGQPAEAAQRRRQARKVYADLGLTRAVRATEDLDREGAALPRPG